MLTASYRRGDHSAVRVPVVMPVVTVTIDTDGLASLALNGEPYTSVPCTRAEVAGLLEQIALDIGTVLRAEVHESDGTRYDDYITPPPKCAPAPVPENVAPPLPATPVPPTREVLASPFGIAADGFSPGETVVVCVVVAAQVTDETGAAQLRLPPALLTAHPQVVLVGRTSGTVALSPSTPPATTVSA